ncbi:unnamed protein product, partial [Protopolystoma xenopodis]
ITELKSYLKAKGAKGLDSIPATAENWVEDLKKCISYISICWKDDTINDSDADDIFTTVASAILSLPPQHLPEIVDLLCKEYEGFSGENIRKHFVMLLSLNVIFSGSPYNNKCKYKAYYAILTCAAKRNTLQQVVTNSIKISEWLDEIDASVDERRELWRKLHEVHAACGDTRRANEFMILLLSTYDEANAATARCDAVRCIISVINDVAILAHDKLLSIKPIQFLEGEPVHKVL